MLHQSIFPTAAVLMGIASNGGAAVIILLSYRSGQMDGWTKLGRGLMLTGAGFVAGIAVALIVAVGLQSRHTACL